MCRILLCGVRADTQVCPYNIFPSQEGNQKSIHIPFGFGLSKLGRIKIIEKKEALKI